MNTYHQKEGHQLLREWAPLTDILEHLPTYYYRGLIPLELSITCIAALDEYLALGTNVGVVFLYDRSNGRVQRYKTEGMKRLTCLKLIDSVEYMLAAGNCDGQVNVFRIFKESNTNFNHLSVSTTRPVERYVIRDLHRNAISCCEWSKNGLKLYTGDRQGIVVLTEFDYETHISKSVEILNEFYEIVQLSSYQGYLLVCSLYRTVICCWNHRNNGRWQITPIKNNEPNELNECGGIFLHNHSFGKKVQILCADNLSSGFYLADIITGQIQKSLKFSQNLKSNRTWEIPLLNPKKMLPEGIRGSLQTLNVNNPPPCSSLSLRPEFKFQNIYQYYINQKSIDSDNSVEDVSVDNNSLMIVTHDSVNLYILNMETLTLAAIAKGFRRILDISVCNREIFILEGSRNIIRLAPMPEKPNGTANIIYSPLLPPPIPFMGNICDDYVGDCNQEPSKDEIIAIDESSNHEDDDVTKAEECFELPPIEAINLSVPIVVAIEETGVADQRQRMDRFKEISQMDFDENILHHSSLNSSLLDKPQYATFLQPRDMNVTKSLGIVEIGRMAQVKVDIDTKSKDTKAHTTLISASVPCQKNLNDDENDDNYKNSNATSSTNYFKDCRRTYLADLSSSNSVERQGKENHLRQHLESDNIRENREELSQGTLEPIREAMDMDASINLQSVYPSFIYEDYNSDLKLMSDKKYDNIDELLMLDSTVEDQSVPAMEKIDFSLGSREGKPDNSKDSSSSEWEFIDNAEI